MIDHYSQESIWLTLAKRIVREHIIRTAQQKEQDDEGIQRIKISQA